MPANVGFPISRRSQAAVPRRAPRTQPAARASREEGASPHAGFEIPVANAKGSTSRHRGARAGLERGTLARQGWELPWVRGSGRSRPGSVQVLGALRGVCRSPGR